MDSKKGRIFISYCGGCGYSSRAYNVRTAVEYQFPSTFEFEVSEGFGLAGKVDLTVYVDYDSKGKLDAPKRKRFYVVDDNFDPILDKIESML